MVSTSWSPNFFHARICCCCIYATDKHVDVTTENLPSADSQEEVAMAYAAFQNDLSLDEVTTSKD